MARFLLLFVAANAYAGPPFRTDDPIPVPYMHGELYLFSTGVIDGTGTSGVGPAIEFNYGVLPNTQFHIILPMAFDAPRGAASYAGYGDTEIGVKYRFVEQSEYVPDIGIFPLVEAPTGNSATGRRSSIFRSGSRKTSGTGRSTAETATGSIRARETRIGISRESSCSIISATCCSLAPRFFTRPPRRSTRPAIREYISEGAFPWRRITRYFSQATRGTALLLTSTSDIIWGCTILFGLSQRSKLKSQKWDSNL